MARRGKHRWVIIGGIFLVAIIIARPFLQLVPPPSTPRGGKPRPSRAPPYTSPSILPVSMQQPQYGSCVCVNGKLSGPQCGLTGHSCSAVKDWAAVRQNCECGPDNIMTGVGCPHIGEDCNVYDNLINPKPAHVHTTCPKGSVLMGTTCVKEYDNYIHPTNASV